MLRRAREFQSELAPRMSALVFFLFVIVGCTFIIIAKLLALPILVVTVSPVIVMLAYAALTFFSRAIQLRDDQTGDNLYYMGFLFTLTSLGVALYKFQTEAGVEDIVQNFGIAISSTIAGIALRVFFNQMRSDPVEVERTARLELSEAARRVKRELDATVIEMNQFRRSVQQVLRDAYLDILKDVSDATKQLGGNSEQMAGSADEIVKALDEVAAKLNEMKTPDQVIEVRVGPLTETLTEAVREFGGQSAAQIGELQKVLVMMRELQARREGAERHLEGAVPALDRTAQSIESLIERFHYISVQLQKRLEEERAP